MAFSLLQYATYIASSVPSSVLQGWKDLGAPAAWIALLVITVLLFMYSLRQPSAGGKLPPGPYSWPLIGSILSVRQPLHAHLAKLSIKYGPLVYMKLGTVRFLVANDAEMAREVLKNHDADFANRPPVKFFKLFSMGYKNLIFTDYGDHWRKMRRIASTELFSPVKLQKVYSSWESSLEALVQSIQGRTVDIGEIAGSCTSKVMCDMLFGVNTVDEEKVTQVFHLVRECGRAGTNANIEYLIPALESFDLHGTFRHLTRIFLPSITSVLKGIIEERRLKQQLGDKSSSSALDTLLLLKDDSSLCDESVMAFLIDMVAAGTDTSHTTLEWAMAELLANPKVMQRAQQELDRVVGKGCQVKVSHLSNLPYIQAIVKETLRLHSVAPLGIPHFNHKAVSIRGYTVPAKTQVLVNIWAISRDPARWSQAEVFKPERFTEKDISVTGQDFNLIPFSAGRRVCAGYTLAMTSIPFILATLIHTLNWEAQGQVDFTEKIRGMVLGRASKLIATAHPHL